MKKKLLLTNFFICIAFMLSGGGIVTNTNQSAYWVRTLVRDASTGIDAVYYNPAGLVRLNDGFHFSLNSQTIFQNKDVTDNYQFLAPSPKKYYGDVKAPVFPGFYAAWKTGRLAVSFGFNPVGGGGGAEFKTGLPSFETSIADLVPVMQVALAPLDAALGMDQPLGYGFDPQFRNITGYNADIYFKGTSVYFGYQLGLSYKINEIFSVFGGARYVVAKNTYKGHIHDVQINASPTEPPAPLYDVPAGSYKPGDYLRAVAGAYGLPAIQVATLNGYAAEFDAATADVEVDAEETGTGFTPILGANIAIGDKLNIGLKYEFKTKLNLEQSVSEGKDGAGMFVPDSTVHSDMPAMMSVGASYRIIPKLSASAGFHYYFDKNANFGKTLDATGEAVSNDQVIDKNTYELAAALEFDINKSISVSAGYLFAKSGVNEDYQSDLSFDLSSNTIGGGLGIRLSDMIMINAGVSYTMYSEGKKSYNHELPIPVNPVPVTDSYFMDLFIFSLGIDFSFDKF